MGKEKLPKRVNLVNRPEWDDYDPAGAVSDTIFQATAETFDSMNEDDAVDLSGLVRDVLYHSPQKGKRIYFSDEEDAALLKAFEGHYREIETFWQMVQDAASWGWEIAYAPSQSDLEEAVKEAVETISERDSSWFYYHEALLALADYFTVEGDTLKKLLLRDYVGVEQEEGWHDRYLVFANRDDEFVEDLLSGGFFRAKEVGPFEWRPGIEVTKEDLKRDLDDFYREIREPFVKEVFSRLKTSVMDMDPSNRFDFKKQWNRIFLDDPARVKAAKKELLAFKKNLERKNG